MATRESPAARGERRSRYLRIRLGEDLGDTRRGLGISLREMARILDVSADRLIRAEAGDAATLTVDLAARMGAVLGKQLAASFFPDGDHVRDQAHTTLLDRSRRRLPPEIALRTEVPIPIAGDRRSGDGVLAVAGCSILVEAETHLGDFQEFERRASAKARDLGVDRIVLLLADTRRHRSLLRDIPAIRERFPIGTRACLAALRDGRDPGGDCLVIL